MNVLTWALDLSNPDSFGLFVVPKSDKDTSWSMFHGKNADLWLQHGVVSAATYRVRRATPRSGNFPIWFPPESGEWELLWGLASVQDFVVDEPLRSLVDQGSFIAYEFYRLLWEARFLTTENVNLRAAQEVVHLITKWISGEPSPDDIGWFQSIGLSGKTPTSAQRCDLLCMLLTLSAQNGILKDFCFLFNHLERAFDSAELLTTMDHLIGSVDRWRSMGGPIGIILGADINSRNLSKLQKAHLGMYERVALSLQRQECLE